MQTPGTDGSRGKDHADTLVLSLEFTQIYVKAVARFSSLSILTVTWIFP